MSEAKTTIQILLPHVSQSLMAVLIVCFLKLPVIFWKFYFVQQNENTEFYFVLISNSKLRFCVNVEIGNNKEF